MSLSKLPQDKIWKYAKTEWERRFLLKERPAQPMHAAKKKIIDKYLHGSRLRLRKTLDGNTTVYKLTKKLQLKAGHRASHWISTIYLDEGEYALFFALPGDFLEKTRYRIARRGGPPIAVDEIKIGKESLWMAEVEFNEAKTMEEYEFPFEFEREITDEEEFAGNAMAKKFNEQNSNQ